MGTKTDATTYSSKRRKFRKLAEDSATRALNAIRVFGKLSNAQENSREITTRGLG